MGDLGTLAERLLRALGPVENVWLVTAGVACVGPLVAIVVPRLARVAGLVVAPAAFVLALAATVYQQPMFALGLITLAVAAALISSWSATTVHQTVGPLVPGPRPEHVVGSLRLTRDQSRSFDYLLMR